GWDDACRALTAGTRVRALSAGARTAGVVQGMTLTAARATAPALEWREWDARVIARAVLAVSAELVAASPQVTPAAGAPGVWWVGASGFDGMGGERALLRQLLGIASRHHPASRVAVADTCIAAHVATMLRLAHGRPLHVVPRGGSHRLLRRAPLSLIPMDDELREALVALGLTTAGAFAALPAGEVERRWGREGLEAQRLARGEDRRRPVLAALSEALSVTLELPDTVDSLEPVLFLLRAGLDRLVTSAAQQHSAIAALTLRLDLDGRDAAGARLAPTEVAVVLAQPGARAAPLFDQCRAMLEPVRLTAPVRALTVLVRETAALAEEQGDLLRPLWRDAAAMEGVFARLRAALGTDAVVRPVARDDGHRIEEQGGWDSDSKSGNRNGVNGNCNSVNGKSAFRLLMPPEPAVVSRRAGAPAVVKWEGQPHLVTRSDGPERLAGHWWAPADVRPYHRDYWRCETARGPLLVYHERGTGEWYVQGWWD
ncbi:MAG TPA: hypothetical protein VFS94_09240, partial [Gemmatimonadales bacterium]|nr:hypothetical protein [Gemmatimonadales bacterium]